MSQVLITHVPLRSLHGWVSGGWITNWDQSGRMGEFTQLLAEKEFSLKTASCGGALIRRFSDSRLLRSDAADN